MLAYYLGTTQRFTMKGRKPGLILMRVVKGGYRSRFTENKAALSQFTKNTTLAFQASRKIKENILENHSSRRLWKSRFTRKKWLFHISQEIKGPITGHESTLYHPH